MDKKSVIAFRNTLYDNGKNGTVRICFDNGINLSLATDLLLWDDDNERVIALISDSRGGSFEAKKPVRVICSTYENIQFIEANFALKELNDGLDKINLSALTITEEQKKAIIDHFNKVYDYRTELKDEFYYNKTK